MGPGGRPVEDFLFCPPTRLEELAKWTGELAHLGVKLVQVGSVWHIFDWVGSQHYPNVADFVEEVRRFGLSRRLPKTLDFSKLTAESRIFLVHDRAWVQPFDAYAANWQGGLQGGLLPYKMCPKPEENPEHDLLRHNTQRLTEADIVKGGGVVTMGGSVSVIIAEAKRVQADRVDWHESTPASMCAGVWWEDVAGGERLTHYQDPAGNVIPVDPGSRMVVRAMPSFSYSAVCRPDGVEPAYKPAYFASFPMTRLVVIRAADGSHESTAEKAAQAEIPLDIENE
jgi:hypothetical protein